MKRAITYLPMTMILKSIYCLIPAILLLAGFDAIAAHRVLLKYGALSRAIAVDELTLLAETGEVSSTLSALLDTAGEDPETLRQGLTEELEVSPVLLDQILNSSLGEWALDQVGEAIHPPSGRASRQALRAAFVLSASDDNQVTPLEVIQNYPTAEVQVEGDRIQDTYVQVVAVVEDPARLLENLDFDF
ncbi:MAG: alpha/beta hydrolase [Leptolyngbyaceae cyanobacterium MO_188.B28]|nr:alpha/beta hydrolase [Leptolyngbyaceae cyanobacterium MO_188.B28]